MPDASWPLRAGRPVIQVGLQTDSGESLLRNLLADTGAGSVFSPFELVLSEDDCISCGGNPGQSVTLGGAYVGSFPVFVLRVRVDALGFDQYVRAVAVSLPPVDFEGLACFRFLNRFAYGNFGESSSFGFRL